MDGYTAELGVLIILKVITSSLDGHDKPTQAITVIVAHIKAATKIDFKITIQAPLTAVQVSACIYALVYIFLECLFDSLVGSYSLIYTCT